MHENELEDNKSLQNLEIINQDLDMPEEDNEMAESELSLLK